MLWERQQCWPSFLGWSTTPLVFCVLLLEGLLAGVLEIGLNVEIDRIEGQMAEAETWYLKALRIQPNHLGANEYLGELYVMTGQMSKAKARLAAIAKICGNTSCEEYGDLYRAIAAKA